MQALEKEAQQLQEQLPLMQQQVEQMSAEAIEKEEARLSLLMSAIIMHAPSISCRSSLHSCHALAHREFHRKRSLEQTRQALSYLSAGHDFSSRCSQDCDNRGYICQGEPILLVMSVVCQIQSGHMSNHICCKLQGQLHKGLQLVAFFQSYHRSRPSAVLHQINWHA